VHTLNSVCVLCTGLRLSDTAVYTCKAVSETGETSWSAALIVEAPSNPSIIFHRTPEPSTFPGAPSKPTLSDIAATSVRLTWHPNTNTGASPIHSYTVEYFSHDTGEVSIQLCSSTCRSPSLRRNVNENHSCSVSSLVSTDAVLLFTCCPVQKKCFYLIAPVYVDFSSCFVDLNCQPGTELSVGPFSMAQPNPSNE